MRSFRLFLYACLCTVFVPLCSSPSAYGQSPTMYRALHMGGHWGENPSGIAEQPREYYNFLRSLGVNWAGISIGLHVANSTDSTVERVSTDPGGVPGFIPTFTDEEIINAIRGFRRNNIEVSLNLCFEIAEAAVAQYPIVRRTDLGDPFVPSRESSVKAENWPWDPGHPKYQSFISSFWRTYTEQAVHFARIAQAEGAKLFVVGAENDRLFRTRSGGPFPNHFKTQIKAMVDSVRRVFSGLVSYELHWGALADTLTFGAGSDHLWEDAGFDIVGVSAYFQLAPSTPTTVMSVSMLEPNWEDAFTRMIIPLKNRNPNLPLLFLEFGYVDVVGSPYFADLDCFTTRVFRDADGNGKDDGEETQANVHEAFFKVNERHSRLVQGIFLWGNDIANNTKWQLSFGQQRTHSVRNKLAAQVVKDYYTLFTQAPQTPVLVSPSSAAQNISVGPTVVWRMAQDASTYSVQVADGTDFISLKVDSTGITDTSMTIQNLQSQKTYYWRVRSNNNAGSSSWSTTFSFTTIVTAPSQPALLAPAPNASAVPLQPTLSWSASTGAVNYRLQVSTQSGFSPLVIDDSTLTSTTKTIGPLASGTKYYWRVNARNAAGSSPWSIVASFTTILAVPPAPTLLTPTPDAASVPTQTTLTWSAATGAASYRLQLSTQPGFSPLVIDDSTLTTTSRTVGSLTEGTKYYWRVNAKNGSGTSPWATVATFTTVTTTLAAPIPLTPVAGAVGVPNQSTLTWSASAGATSYRVQLSMQQDFGTLVLDDSLLTTTSRAVGPLAEGTVYHWRVRAKSAGSLSPWSTAVQFTTAILPPTPPILLSPAAGALGVSLQPTLSWGAAINGQLYILQLSASSSFSLLLVEDTALAVTSRPVGPLTSGTTYYWRVRSRNVGGIGPWSSVFSFTTQVASSVEWLGDANITEYLFHGNYPNPFNPTTMLSYQIPEASYVRLSVFDALGTEVVSLVRNWQPRGLYRIEFNGEGFPSGVYFVSIQAGAFRATGRMVLIR